MALEFYLSFNTQLKPAEIIDCVIENNEFKKSDETDSGDFLRQRFYRLGI